MRAALSRWWVRCALLVAVTAVLAVLAAPRVANLEAQASLLPAEHPWVRLDREITAQFGFENPVVWVVAAPDTVWTAEHLREVQEVTHAALRIPGVIATDVISIASPNMRDLRVSDSSLQPIYLMAEVPATPEELEGLHQRVDTDPNYRGMLTSIDGRAAIVVANFRSDADARTVGAAARALQAAHRDSGTNVYVAGAPLIETMPLPLDLSTLGTFAAFLAALAWLCIRLGAGPVLRGGVAALLAVIWTVAVAAAVGLAQIPWTAYAVPYTAVVAATSAALPRDAVGWRARIMIALALAGAFAGMWHLQEFPASAFATAGAAASLLAMLVSILCAPATGQADGAGAPAPPAARLGTRRRGWWLGGLVLTALAVLGVPRLRTSLSLAGYGERYLPGAEGYNLRAIARYFPPPTVLAIRFRGAPRFVTSPAALHALDDIVAPLRADPSIVSAMSVADLVKLVNQAFNDNDPAFAVLPDDEGLVARYLTLAYSPGFRRFVDRSLSTAAIWIYVADDNPTHLAQVLERVRTQLALQPVANAEVDLVGGDGAKVLVMAATLRSLTVALVVWLACAAALLALLSGWRTARRAVLGGLGALIVMATSYAWLGVPLDLVSAPLLASITAAGTGLAALTNDRTATPLRALGVAFGIAGAVCVVIPYAGPRLLGSACLALGIVSKALTPTRDASPSTARIES